MTDIFLRMLEVTAFSSAIILAVFIFRAFFAKRIKPGIIGMLWALVLLRLCLPVMLESPVHLPQLIPQRQESAAEQPAYMGAINPAYTVDYQPEPDYMPDGYEFTPQTGTTYQPASAQRPDASSPKVDWLAIAAYAWIAGAAATLLTAVWKGASFGRRVKRCEVYEKAVHIADGIRLALKIRRKVPVRVCPGITAPVLFGFLRPQILLPENCNADNETLRCILAHELCHVKRRDILKGYMWLMAKAAHWFNPLVWFAYAACKDDIELCCDGTVLRLIGTDNKFMYTQSLIDMFRSYRRALPLAVPLFENKPKLTERVMRMLKPNKRSKAAAALSVLLALIMLVAGFTTACSPAAQAADITEAPQQTAAQQLAAAQITQPEPTPSITPAKPAYEAPDRWIDSFEQGTLQVNVDADIVVSNVTSIPTYEVDPHATFSQEEADKFIEAFLGNAELYQAAAPTQADITLKLQIAEDNLLSMEIGAFDFSDGWDETRKNAEIEKARDYRDGLKGMLSSAPDKPELVPFNSRLISDEQGIALICCYADLGGAEPAKLWIRNTNYGAGMHFRNNGWYNVQFPNKVLTAPIGDLTISEEDAKLKADGLLKSLGFGGYECRTSFIAGKLDVKNHKTIDGVYAHAFVYTRNVADMPAASKVIMNNNADERTSFKLCEYQPETIYITVNDKGFCDFELENMYRQGKAIEQEAELVPFDEISGVIRQQICKVYEPYGDSLSNEVGHGDGWTKTEKYILSVDRVSLEYARVPLGGDLDKQVLVPVWSVYATGEWQFWKLKDGEKYLETVKDPLSSLRLTVNAIDGSIIGESNG